MELLVPFPTAGGAPTTVTLKPVTGARGKGGRMRGKQGEMEENYPRVGDPQRGAQALTRGVQGRCKGARSVEGWEMRRKG